MNEHAFQIILVATGALIGLVSSLVAVWLTSLQAKAHHRKERLARVHELIGKRCALRGSDPKEEVEIWSKWLSTKDAARLDRIAFMTGFVETNNVQLQEILQEGSRQQAKLAETKTESVKLQREVDRLTEEKSALESKKEVLLAQKKLDQNSRSSQGSITSGFDANAT